ncbi:hypothetical protein AGABI1DRAFT_34378, partial [Agaricus bisporus var. burnettii JB137-S8]
RLEDIQRREAELERRETELHQKAEHIRKHGRNNWPFFYPLIFHSIQDEIPEPSRFLITRLYHLWLVLLLTLILNFVACLFVFFADNSQGSDLGASIGYVFIISVTSFLLWYRPIYNGYMKSALRFNLFLYTDLYFFFGGFHLLFSAYIPFVYLYLHSSTGSAGLIQTIRQFIDHHWAAAILGLIATVGWIIQGFGNAFYYRQANLLHLLAQQKGSSDTIP